MTTKEVYYAHIENIFGLRKALEDAAAGHTGGTAGPNTFVGLTDTPAAITDKELLVGDASTLKFTDTIKGGTF